MDTQEVKWEHYPHVAAQAAARSFVERLVLKGKRPKTVDAYARAIEDLLAFFSTYAPGREFEADEADLDRYIAHLRQRDRKARGRGGMIEDQLPILSLRGASSQTTPLRNVLWRVVSFTIF